MDARARARVPSAFPRAWASGRLSVVPARPRRKATDVVRVRPYSVLFFDEIEKADCDVFNILLRSSTTVA
jgi:hypothetical protein